METLQLRPRKLIKKKKKQPSVITAGAVKWQCCSAAAANDTFSQTMIISARAPAPAANVSPAEPQWAPAPPTAGSRQTCGLAARCWTLGRRRRHLQSLRGTADAQRPSGDFFFSMCDSWRSSDWGSTFWRCPHVIGDNVVHNPLEETAGHRHRSNQNHRVGPTIPQIAAQQPCKITSRHPAFHCLAPRRRYRSSIHFQRLLLSDVKVWGGVCWRIAACSWSPAVTFQPSLVAEGTQREPSQRDDGNRTHISAKHCATAATSKSIAIDNLNSEHYCWGGRCWGGVLVNGDTTCEQLGRFIQFTCEIYF